MSWVADVRRGPREGWLSVLLLGVTLWAVVHSVEEAQWVDHLDPLVPLTFAAILVGLAAARSALRTWSALLIGLLIGVEALVLVYANRLVGPSWQEKLGQLVAQVAAWLEVAAGGGNSRDNLMFAIVMAAIAWALGLGTSWLVYRLDRGWAAVLVAGVALMLHLSYSYTTLNYHFYVLLFAGLLLLVRLELARRQAFWQSAGLIVQGRVVRNVVVTSAAAILLVMNVARLAPDEQPSEMFGPAWARVSDWWQRGQSQLDRLFGGVQGPPIVVVGLAFSDTLQPRQGFELGMNPVLKIETPRLRYWRTATYDQYTGQGIVNGGATSERVEADQSIALAFGAGEAREEMEQTITVLAAQSNLVFAADAPIRVSVPTLLEWRGSTDDPAALRLTTLLRKGQQYTVVSAASVATEAQLRGAGVAYPPGLERYLQLPPELPARVRRAAAEVAAGAPTPYDQAVAIERYLRGLSYETRLEPPPSDRDWVDYTLFDAQAGYSDYLSTSMMVMLRTLGVPARVASGFAPGSYDEQEAAYIVYESEAHSWVEVFFPAYGWITFDPSVIRPLPFRAPEEGSIPIDGFGDLEGMLGEGGDPFYEDPFLEGFGDFPQPGLPDRRDTAWIVALGFVAAFGAGLGLAYLAILGMIRRGLRGLPWHVQWYAQLRRLAGWAGLGGRASQTPHEYAGWLEERFPTSRSLVRPITDVYVEGRYSGREPGPERLAMAASAWEQARPALARRVMLRGVIATQQRVRQLREWLPISARS